MSMDRAIEDQIVPLVVEAIRLASGPNPPEARIRALVARIDELAPGYDGGPFFDQITRTYREPVA